MWFFFFPSSSSSLGFLLLENPCGIWFVCRKAVSVILVEMDKLIFYIHQVNCYVVDSIQSSLSVLSALIHTYIHTLFLPKGLFGIKRGLFTI